MFLIVEMIISFGLNFVFCELGERVQNAFNEIGYDLEQVEWYLLPPDIAKTLPIVIVNVDRPVIITCFGSIPCARETYKAVLHNMNQTN